MVYYNFAEIDLFLRNSESVFDSSAFAQFLNIFDGFNVGKEQGQVKFIVLCSFRAELQAEARPAFWVDPHEDRPVHFELFCFSDYHVLIIYLSHFQ